MCSESCGVSEVCQGDGSVDSFWVRLEIGDWKRWASLNPLILLLGCDDLFSQSAPMCFGRSLGIAEKSLEIPLQLD